MRDSDPSFASKRRYYRWSSAKSFLVENRIAGRAGVGHHHMALGGCSRYGRWTTMAAVVGEDSRGDDPKEAGIGCRDLTAAFLIDTEEARHQVGGFGPAVANRPGPELDGHVVGIIEGARQGLGVVRPRHCRIPVLEIGFDHLAREEGETGLDAGVAHHDGLHPPRLAVEYHIDDEIDVVGPASPRCCLGVGLDLVEEELPVGRGGWIGRLATACHRSNEAVEDVLGLGARQDLIDGRNEVEARPPAEFGRHQVTQTDTRQDSLGGFR